MGRISILSAVLLAAMPLMAPPAAAQAAGKDAVQAFVEAFATPTRITGKIARWEDGICPLVMGQQPAITKFVTQRVKDVAATVGAPVNDAPSCTPNIEILFTRMPEELLGNIRKHQSEYLGYAESNSERDRLASVTRPVQAWYTTQTRDLHGLDRIDTGERRGEGVSMPCFTCTGRSAGPTLYLSEATFAQVTGNRVSDGVRSAFYHVIIVADVNRLKGYEAGPLADYIALLALAQLNSLDSCLSLPSVETMLAKGCEAKTGALTRNDIAYLRGLYRMSADRKLLASQKSEIADSMNAALSGQ